MYIDSFALRLELYDEPVSPNDCTTDQSFATRKNCLKCLLSSVAENFYVFVKNFKVKNSIEKTHKIQKIYVEFSKCSNYVSYSLISWLDSRTTFMWICRGTNNLFNKSSLILLLLVIFRSHNKSLGSNQQEFTWSSID